MLLRSQWAVSSFDDDITPKSNTKSPREQYQGQGQEREQQPQPLPSDILEETKGFNFFNLPTSRTPRLVTLPITASCFACTILHRHPLHDISVHCDRISLFLPGPNYNRASSLLLCNAPHSLLNHPLGRPLFLSRHQAKSWLFSADFNTPSIRLLPKRGHQLIHYAKCRRLYFWANSTLSVQLRYLYC